MRKSLLAQVGFSRAAASAFALAVIVAIAGVARAGNWPNNPPPTPRPPLPSFHPNSLVVTRSVYEGTADTVQIGQVLPPGCPAPNPPSGLSYSVTVPEIPSGSANVTVTCSIATNDGTYPYVFSNDAADGSFSVSSPVFLDNIDTNGQFFGALAIPPDMIVTSFESKSELAVNLSSDRKSLTFMGYVNGTGVTGVNQLDISNSNTPAVIDPTNPDVGQFYRAVAEVDAFGHIQVTDGNAYSGDNGRAVIKGNNSIYYMVGNSNNGGLSKSELLDTQAGIDLTTATGAELLVPGQAPAVPPDITMIGDFLIGQVIDPATGVDYTTVDKAGKDDNFRGVTIFDNTLYVSKGSGSNGINTVYQVGSPGVLPTGDEVALHTVPIVPLPGFPTTPASGTDGGKTVPVLYPFGMWFANANTLYVCDEGDGILETPGPNGNVAGPEALADGGVQKWRFNGTEWQLLYVLQDGLNIGLPYGVKGLPTAFNPATDGCRNLTGNVNPDGTVTIYAVTSTVSASGDQGGDPNQLVKVNDVLDSLTLPVNDDNAPGRQLAVFHTVETAGFGEVLRGVAFAPQE
jgi:hypothetical protein